MEEEGMAAGAVVNSYSVSGLFRDILLEAVTRSPATQPVEGAFSWRR